MAACLGLGCVPWGGCLGLGCRPWPWLRALALAACHGGLPWLQALAFAAAWPWPWPWLRALALAACHGGLPWLQALAACLGLGSMPCPWLHAMALAACLGLGCMPWGGYCLGLCCLAHKFRVISQKMRVFWKRRLFAPKRQALGMAGCPGACPHARHAASPRIVPHSGKIGSCLFPFLCS